MNRIEASLTAYEQGFNCSQSILSGFCPEFGLDRSLALRLATSFGGGMGQTGMACGAVSGALMVIGLKYGQNSADDREAKEHTYQLAQRFMDEFRFRHNDVNCSGLLGVDISSADGLAYAREHALFNRFCPAYVRAAAEILDSILEE